MNFQLINSWKNNNLYEVALKRYIILLWIIVVNGQVRLDGGVSSSNQSVEFSTGVECMRPCVDGSPPRTCYYRFIVEYYEAMGSACNLCKPTIINQLTGQPQCECILADGYEKTVLSINRMIPGPSIQVCLHDKVVVDVVNQADGLELTIHWHGLFQKNYQYYDGVPFVTQCPIGSENTFRYQFAVDNGGTHFYHSHISTQMVDGQYGALVVRKPPSEELHYASYDEDRPDHVIVLSDWFHEFSLKRYPGLARHDVGQTAENILINGLGNWKDPTTGISTDVPLAMFYVEKGKRYRFRVINSFSTVCLADFSIQNHPLLVIAVDGEDIVPVSVTTVVTASGERFDFVLEANQTASSYWIQVRGLEECGKKQVQQFGILSYAGTDPKIISTQPSYSDSIPGLQILNPTDASTCDIPLPKNEMICINQLKSLKPTDKRLLSVKPDYRIVLPFKFFFFNQSLDQLYKPNSFQKFFVTVDSDTLLSAVSNISFKNPPAPPLSQREGYEHLCSSTKTPRECKYPCSCSHAYHLKKNSVVELVVYDEYPQALLAHPFHLHGYSYSVFAIGQIQESRNLTSNDIDKAIAEHETRLMNGQYNSPPGKDTVVVPNQGWIIVRFIADNPGWWLFHCHFVWHEISGMNVLFNVGTKADLPPVPKGFPKCNSWLGPPIS